MESTSDQRNHPGPELCCRADQGFVQWLAASGGTLLITTYQANLVALVGSRGGQVKLHTKRFDKPMGAAARGDQLAIASRESVDVLASAPRMAPEYPPGAAEGYDCLFLPRASFLTCSLQVHDVAFGSDDEIWIVNTRFSCLGVLSQRFSFEPRWQPGFIDELTPEDRCHLNGMAVIDGRPKFVTALGATNEAGGWRANKAAGGLLINVESGETVLSGLCMPHSPRWHDGMLWFLNSGRGQLCVLQPGEHQHTVVCQLPGYARGLAFAGMHALVGLSLIREQHTFGGLPIGEDNTKLHCAIAVVDLSTGQLTGMLDFTSGFEEIYEVLFLPAVRHGMLLTSNDDTARLAISAPEFAYWMSPGQS